jgi:hypothetical protein
MGNCITSDMHQYLGKQAIIKYVGDDYYDLDIDNETSYYLQDWMLISLSDLRPLKLQSLLGNQNEI